MVIWINFDVSSVEVKWKTEISICSTRLNIKKWKKSKSTFGKENAKQKRNCFITWWNTIAFLMNNLIIIRDEQNKREKKPNKQTTTIKQYVWVQWDSVRMV